MRTKPIASARKTAPKVASIQRKAKAQVNPLLLGRNLFLSLSGGLLVGWLLLGHLLWPVHWRNIDFEDLTPSILRTYVLDMAQAYEASGDSKTVVASLAALNEPLRTNTLHTIWNESVKAGRKDEAARLEKLAGLAIDKIVVTVLDSGSHAPVPAAQLYAQGKLLGRADDKGQVTLAKPAVGNILVKAPGYTRTEAVLGEALFSKRNPNCADPCLGINLNPFVVRAIYVPQGLLYAPKKLDDFLAQADPSKGDINALIVDFKGDTGFFAHPSKIALAIEMKNMHTEDAVDLKAFVMRAKAQGTYMIARIVTFKDDQLATHKTAWAVKRANGAIWKDGENLAWANPSIREVQDYNIAIAREAAQMGFDEVNYDYIRFPSDGDISAISFNPPLSTEERQAAIRGFISRASAEIRPLGPFLSADVFGLTVWLEPEVDMGIAQRVKDIAPNVDYLAPMIYPSTFIPGNLGYANPSDHPYDVISRSSQIALTRVPPGTQVRPWLQAYWYPPEAMITQRKAAEEAKACGWSFWNAGGVYPQELRRSASSAPGSCVPLPTPTPAQ